MFSMCSELTPRAPIPDTRIPQLMQPCVYFDLCLKVVLLKAQPDSLHIKLLAWGSFSLKGERDKEMTLFVASQGVCMR